MVVETRDHVLVYDTGAGHAAGIVASYLGWRGRASIDTIVISHADSDHIGGYPALVRRLPALQVFANEGVPGAHRCIAGLSWTWNSVRFDTLHPPSPRWRGNDGSCVLRVSTAGRAMLLTGDIETRAERWMLGHVRDLRTDILLAPHHGSRTSSHPEFLDATDAGHAVFSVRHGNSWHMPDPAVLARYGALGTTVHRTDQHGAIITSIRSSGAIEFRHWRTGWFWHAP